MPIPKPLSSIVVIFPRSVHDWEHNCIQHPNESNIDDAAANLKMGFFCVDNVEKDVIG